MVYVLGPRDKKRDCLIVNTTTSSKSWSRHLSPMLLGPVEVPLFGRCENVENAWQFSKVYKDHIAPDDNPNAQYWVWSNRGFRDTYAHRYPMGKGAIPEYSLWEGEKLNYIEARKKIYIPLYAEAVRKTKWYKVLEDMYKAYNREIALWDFDGYDYIKLGMTLEQVVNNPDRKMGHAFVLAMMLEGLA